MSRSFDVLVAGAGIQGATATWEAARRGLSVLLVDRGDLGGGSSSSSMKIAHGGLRSLQSLDLRRGLESIRERRRLLRLAPHRVRPLPCRLEVADESPLFRLAFRAGLLANDVLSAGRNRGVRPDRRLPRGAFPVWYDAIIDDTERLLLDFVHGACAANPGGVEVRCRAPLLDVRSRDGGRLAARIDGLGEVEVGCVLRCIGAARADAAAALSMNLLVDALPLSAEGMAVALRHPEAGRHVFVVPWRGRSIVGTWDRAYPHDPAEPLRVDPGWVDDMLAWLAPVHPQLSALRRSDVRFVHAGLLPTERETPARPSDRARIERDGAEVDVRGVKWTTAWGLSARAVARAAAQHGRSHRAPAPSPVADSNARIEAWLDAAPERRAPLLPGRCGLERGRVRFAVEQEWAHGLGDVLLRRTGVASAGHPGRALADAVAALLQRTLGWSDAERRAEVEAFHADFRFAGNVPAD